MTTATKEKVQEQIAIMQAFVDGKEIQCRLPYHKEHWEDFSESKFNWEEYEYRIKVRSFVPETGMQIVYDFGFGPTTRRFIYVDDQIGFILVDENYMRVLRRTFKFGEEIEFGKVFIEDGMEYHFIGVVKK